MGGGHAGAAVDFAGAPHLHNDLADFGASGGILGLLAYALLLVAPVVQVVSSPEAPTRRWPLAVMVVIVLGFFLIGLTNAMSGILNLTVCHAAYA